MHVIVLAGGFATRLWPLTEKTAKPLVPLAGKTLLSFLIEKIPETLPITISTNAVFADDFETWKAKYFSDRNIDIFIEDSVSETEKKGALAATALCIKEKNIKEDLLLLAGDNYFGFDFKDFIKNFSKHPILAAYDVKNPQEAKKFGVVVPEEKTKKVKAFQEKPENPLSTLVSTGAYIFPKKYLSCIDEYSQKHGDDLGGIFEFFLQKNISVDFFSFSQEWFDIGSFSAFLQANQFLLQNEKIIESGSKKDEKTVLEGGVFIGKNVSLENVLVENSLILEGSTLKNTEIKNCVVGKNVTIENIDFYGKIIRDESFLVVKR